jgi:hypothetical protein
VNTETITDLTWALRDAERALPEAARLLDDLMLRQRCEMLAKTLNRRRRYLGLADEDVD